MFVHGVAAVLAGSAAALMPVLDPRQLNDGRSVLLIALTLFGGVHAVHAWAFLVRGTLIHSKLRAVPSLEASPEDSSCHARQVSSSLIEVSGPSAIATSASRCVVDRCDYTIVSECPCTSDIFRRAKLSKTRRRLDGKGFVTCVAVSRWWLGTGHFWHPPRVVRGPMWSCGGLLQRERLWRGFRRRCYTSADVSRIG